jgi:hypothetical protein
VSPSYLLWWEWLICAIATAFACQKCVLWGEPIVTEKGWGSFGSLFIFFALVFYAATFLAGANAAIRFVELFWGI